MNKFIAIGRLGRDPEGKNFEKEDGTTIDKAEFSLAINSGFGSKQITTWVDCEAYNALARNVCRYMHKGDLMGIVGKLKINVFTNKQGQKVKMTKIVVEEMQYLPKQSGEVQQNPEDEYIPEASAEGVEAPKMPDDGFVDVPDGIEESLPFR